MFKFPLILQANNGNLQRKLVFTIIRRKVIKKIIKISFGAFVTLFILLGIVVLVVTSSRFQTAQIQRITRWVEGDFGIPITVGEVKLSFSKKANIQDLCIYDQSGDTILFTPRLKVDFNSFSKKDRVLSFSEVEIAKPRINFVTDSLRDINFQYILDKLSKDDTTNVGMSIKIAKIRIDSADFSYQQQVKTHRAKGIKYDDIKIDPLTIIAHNFETIPKNGIVFRLDTLRGTESSGFDIERLSAQVAINSKTMSFKDFEFHSSVTDLHTNEVSLVYQESSKDMGGGRFNEHVNLIADIKPSVVAFSDLSYFVPSFSNIDEVMEIEGQVRGTVSDLNVKDLRVKVASETRFAGNVEMKGLPNIDNTYIYCKVEDMYITPDDLERFPSAKNTTGRLVLPSILHRLGYVNFDGNFIGFLQDFVAYGNFKTKLGDFSTDVLFTPLLTSQRDSLENQDVFSYNGWVKSSHFNLGGLFDSSNVVGHVSLETSVDGTMSSNVIVTAELNGNISELEVNNYAYKDIVVNGKVKGKTYDGVMEVNDPHLESTFSGMMDLSTDIPIWRFNADVRKSDLYHLHIAPSDTAYFASFKIDADFSGNKIDNIDGEIRLKDAKIKKTDKVLEMSDFFIFTKKIAGDNRFILRSDVVDAEVWGQYTFSTIKNSFLALINNNLPSLVFATDLSNKEADNNNFNYDVNFKNTTAVMDFFMPGIKISRRASLKGEFMARTSKASMDINIPYVEIKDKSLYDIQSQISFNPDSSIFQLTLRQLSLGETLNLDNFTASAIGVGDSVKYSTNWGVEKGGFKGDLDGVMRFIKRKDKMSIINFDFNDGYFRLNGNNWTLSPGFVSVDTSSVRLESFSISNDTQRLFAHGNLSSSIDEVMEIGCENMDISAVNIFLDPDKLCFEGRANGRIELQHPYDKPIIIGDIAIDSLCFNQEYLGDAVLKANFDQTNRDLSLYLAAMAGNRRSLYVSGDYLMDSGQLNFDVNMQDISANVIQPFLIGIFSDIRGTVSSELKLGGKLRSPKLEGLVTLNNIGWRVDFLNTYYTFNARSRVSENVFVLDNFNIVDSRGQVAVFSGNITHQYFKKFRFDFGLHTNNFEALNLSSADNDLFYGQAYMSGDVKIYGLPANLTFDAKVATLPNTKIYIPFTSQSGVATVDYISFIEKEKPQVLPTKLTYEDFLVKDDEQKEVYVVNRNGVTLNIEVEATPSAEVYLILDPKTGEQIRGNGSGNLRFNLTPTGRFNMYGTYIVESGDYLFTLQNLFQRKFSVLRGGSILWNGDPADAIINMSAVYSTRTSLTGLTSSNLTQNASKRTLVECILHLNNKLTKPDLTFDVNIPEVEQDVSDLLTSLFYNEEQKAKQVISLLVLNSFYSESFENNIDASSIATDVLSNQISRMLGDLSERFSLGVNYQRNNQLQAQIIELTASALLLKSRMNVDLTVANREIVNTSNPVTFDGNIEYRLSNSGKYYLKAFNRSNDMSLLEPDIYYTQGLGLMYRSDFDRLSELFVSRKKKLLMEQAKSDSMLINVNAVINDNQ